MLALTDFNMSSVRYDMRSVCKATSSKGVNSCIFDFSGEEEWRAEQRDGSEVLLQWSAETQDISVISDSYFPMYFVAPRRSFEKCGFLCYLCPFCSVP